MNDYKNKESINVACGGCGFSGLLTIAFIVLKLCGVIDWSWWLVFLPLIISIGLPIAIILFMLLGCFIWSLCENAKNVRTIKKKHKKPKQKPYKNIENKNENQNEN